MLRIANQGRRTGLGSLAAAGASLVMASAALAQDAAAPAAASDGTPASEWVKLCSENPQNKQKVCVVTRERRAATGQLLAAISIREVAEKKILVTAVPPGMLIRPGLQVQIDGGKPTKSAYQICFPNLCFSEVEVKADFITAMKKGTKLVVTTLNQQAKPVNFDVALTGFTQSYDGEAIDPKALQQKQVQLQEELRKRAEEARQALIKKQQEASGAAAADPAAAPAPQ